MVDNYLVLKQKLQETKVQAFKLRLGIVRLGLIFSDKKWLLEDPTVLERYTNLIGMANDSLNNITELEKELHMLDQKGILFSLIDLEDEFDLIHENLVFETNYWRLTKNLLELLDDYNIQGDDIFDYLTRNDEVSSLCFNQVKINQSSLIKLKKERRDILE